MSLMSPLLLSTLISFDVECGCLMMTIFLPKINTLLSRVAATKSYLGEGSLAVGRVLHSVSSSTSISVESNLAVLPLR